MLAGSGHLQMLSWTAFVSFSKQKLEAFASAKCASRGFIFLLFISFVLRFLCQHICNNIPEYHLLSLNVTKLIYHYLPRMPYNGLPVDKVVRGYRHTSWLFCNLYKFKNLPLNQQTEPFYLPACYRALECWQGVGTCKCFHGQLL